MGYLVIGLKYGGEPSPVFEILLFFTFAIYSTPLPMVMAGSIVSTIAGDWDYNVTPMAAKLLSFLSSTPVI